MSGPVALFQDVWVCSVCGAERRTDSGGGAPVCGEFSSDMNRFPDGGWVRVEQWSPHPPMVRGERVPRVDPGFVAIAEGAIADRQEAMRVAAEESVRRANEAAGVTGALPGVDGRCERGAGDDRCLLRAGHAGDCVSHRVLARWDAEGVEYDLDALDA